MQKRYLLRLLGVTIVAGALAAFFFLVVPPSPPVARLANGTELTLLGVTHGATNVMFPAGFRDRLVNRLAPNGTHLGPIKIEPVKPVRDDWLDQAGSIAFSNKMVVWIGHSGPSNAPPLPAPRAKWFSDFRVTVSGENGEEWDMPTTIAPRLVHSLGINYVTPLDFPSFPRRGKTLRLRIYSRNNFDRWDTLADFKLPNPCPGPYPVWNASRLPITQKSNDLEISLVELVSGTKEIPHRFGDRPFTRATFAVKENGQSTEAWVPDKIDPSDATGNELNASILDHEVTNGLVSFEFWRAGLDSNEVWKLRTRFSKYGDRVGKVHWASPQLLVQGGTLAKVSLTTNVDPFQITFECEQGRFPNSVRLKLSPAPKEMRLCVPEIIDDQGRTVKYKSGSIGESGFDAQWEIPPGAKWIQVKIRVVETRTFEFVARPTSILPAPR